jgi:photosystem II stability/assembly factor-like uncharacterized protein
MASEWTAIESGTSAELSGVWADARKGRLWTIAREPSAVRMRDASGAWVEWGFDAWHEPLAIAGSGDAVCVATNGEMLRAEDGTTWKRTTMRASAIVAREDGALFARTDDAIVSSRDGGATWSRVDASRTITAILRAREPAAASGGTLYVASAKDGRVRVLVSRDAGASFALSDLGLIGEPTAVVAESAEDALVVGRAGLARATHDGGATWRRERIVTGADLLGACVDERGRVYVVGDAGVIFARES